MKAEFVKGAGLILELADYERKLLVRLLSNYPRVPGDHMKLSRGTAALANSESNELVSQAFAERRAENNKTLQRLLENPGRFAGSNEGWRLTLSRGELEWFLEVLNDIRVGSWVALGCPEKMDGAAFMRKNRGADFSMMEIAGYFQNEIIGALNAG